MNAHLSFIIQAVSVAHFSLFLIIIIFLYIFVTIFSALPLCIKRNFYQQMFVAYGKDRRSENRWGRLNLVNDVVACLCSL